jgi:hypothetical protein
LLPPTATPTKQGFLFRFASNDVSPASKPRGIVDLSTVTDVADGGAATGRPHSIKLSTATGHICYLCESETSQVGGWVGGWVGTHAVCLFACMLACCVLAVRAV